MRDHFHLKPSISLTRMPNKRLRPRAAGHTGAVRALVISRDGLRLYSASEDKTVRCWDALRGDCIQARDAPVGSVVSSA